MANILMAGAAALMLSGVAARADGLSHQCYDNSGDCGRQESAVSEATKDLPICTMNMPVSQPCKDARPQAPAVASYPWVNEQIAREQAFNISAQFCTIFKGRVSAMGLDHEYNVCQRNKNHMLLMQWAVDRLN